MKPELSEIDLYIADRRKTVTEKLESYILSVRQNHSGLADAVAHTLRNGKKIRPVLCIAACESTGGDIKQAIPVACAIEMVHTYSLIHDDLPSMDNDDTRRGLPSTHKLFGEAAAVLAGDLLLTDSFGFLVSEGKKSGIADSALVQIVETVSACAGKSGMAVGQMMDLENASPGEEQTSVIHSLKTGSLIEAAVRCGAIAGGADRGAIESLAEYAKNLGIAFQTVDDIIDSDEPGKQTDAKQKARRFTELAREALKNFDGHKTTLEQLAQRLCERTV